MGLLRVYDLMCDDCSGTLGEMTFDAVELRKSARSEGWVRRDGRDLCDECKGKPANSPGLHKPKRRRKRDVDLFNDWDQNETSGKTSTPSS